MNNLKRIQNKKQKTKRDSKKLTMKFFNFKIVIQQEEDGNGYYAYSPNLPGCYSNGKTIEETRINIRDAIQLHILSLLSNNQTVPQVEREVFTEEISIGMPI